MSQQQDSKLAVGDQVLFDTYKCEISAVARENKISTVSKHGLLERKVLYHRVHIKYM